MKESKKVLIVSYYWPPSGGSGVQRWLKFVKYLTSYSFETFVFTPDNSNFSFQDSSLHNEIPSSVKVIRKPISKLEKLLLKFTKNSNESAGFLSENPSIIQKLVLFVRANFFIPDAKKKWVISSINQLENICIENSISTVITTGPPHSMHLIGIELKKRIDIDWIADFRDPWVEIDYFHKLPFTKRSIFKHKTLEKQVVSTADKVIVIGKSMKSSFEKYSKNVHVITNGFDDEIGMKKTNILGTKFSLTHVGLMNADRNPIILWKVLSELLLNTDLNQHLEIKLIGTVAEEVKDAINTFNLTPFVSYIDYLPHKEIGKYQHQSQILCVFVNNVPSAKGIITGKIFEYLNAKRPILAIAPTNGDLAEIITQTNSGVTVDFNDEVSLKNILIDWFEKFKENKLEVTSKGIEKYHRKNLTKQLVDLINS